MASKKSSKKARRKPRRSDDSLLNAAIIRAHFVPYLKKFRKRKTLKKSEKRTIKKWEKLLPYIGDLKKVDKRQAKVLKENLYRPVTIIRTGPRRGQKIYHRPIQGIALRNTSSKAKITKAGKGRMLVEDHGRSWVYLNTPDTRPATIAEYGEAAFAQEPSVFDIEALTELAERAFDNPETRGVALWSRHGRVGDIQPSFQDFIYWVGEYYQKYKETDEWVNGLAVLVAEEGDEITDEEWDAFHEGYDDED